MVVIAIIGILAALLLPALNRGKAAAQGAQCASNLRQLIDAWQMYIHDSNDQLPCNADGQDGRGVFTNWVAGTMSRPTDATNSALLIDREQSAFAKNSIQYEAALTFLTERIKNLNSAITG